MIRRRIQGASRRILVTCVLVSWFAIGALGIILHQELTSDDTDITSSGLHSAVDGHSELEAYLAEQKDAEAHFVAIANLVRAEQKESLDAALLRTLVPVAIGAALMGYVAAKYLLRPVREAYESQERFLQDAAHELRNPLAAMNLAIQNEQAKSSKPSEFLTTMRRQTRRLIDINEDLLYLERGTADAALKIHNVSELLHDVLEDVRPIITEKSLQLHTNIDADVMYKIAPADFIKLARNVIENAVKYTAKNGEVTVSLSGDKQTVLTVQDTGIGISKKDLRHIGERFYRAENANDQDGTGLGITIVQKIVNLYGGSMDISSTLGKGTTVTIKL